jgi:hypothetical protein
MHSVLASPVSAVQGRGSWRLLAPAVAALTLGVLVYLLDRPPGSVRFIPPGFSLARGHAPYFGALGGQLPDAAHVYAFILLTLFVRPATARVGVVCAAWWFAEVLLKLAQHPMIAPYAAGASPGWFQHVPLLRNSAVYFMRGTFDPLDLMAITLGAAAAYVTHRIVLHRGSHL